MLGELLDVEVTQVEILARKGHWHNFLLSLAGVKVNPFSHSNNQPGVLNRLTG